ncbi:hypothetical protein RHSP_61017 [Rhizobium freirei PRF 81]|uniref:Uncharacterized protein n=1 Tax=Rhizobium freirei PRF 81 TaxID=363754 RepID=N6V6Q9_9HYPH|nr:hypothetical protein RHSP_61017 [Rhizobium freirei PRF 81]
MIAAELFRRFRLRPFGIVSAQDHAMRGEHGAAGHEQAGERNAPTRLGKAEERQDQRRQQRRRIACGAENLDIAVLDAVVPGIEGRSDGEEAEAEHGDPLCHPLRPDGLLQAEMAEEGEDGCHEAEYGDDVGGYGLETARDQRIAGPGEGAKKSRAVADRIGAFEMKAVAADDQNCARKPHQRADDVIPAQPLARQQGRADDDQKRPEIGDQPRFHRRRMAQRREIEEMVAEQAGNARYPDLGGLTQKPQALRPEQQHDDAGNAADGKTDGKQLKRLHLAGRHRQKRQERPHQNGRKARQCRAKLQLCPQLSLLQASSCLLAAVFHGCNRHGPVLCRYAHIDRSIYIHGIGLGKPDLHLVALGEIEIILARALIAALRREAHAAGNRLAREALGRERMSPLWRQLQIQAHLAVEDGQRLIAEIEAGRDWKDHTGNRIEHGLQIRVGKRDPVVRPLRFGRDRIRRHIAVGIGHIVGALLLAALVEQRVMRCLQLVVVDHTGHIGPGIDGGDEVRKTGGGNVAADRKLLAGDLGLEIRPGDRQAGQRNAITRFMPQHVGECRRRHRRNDS